MTLIFSFMGRNNTLSHIILNYVHPHDMIGSVGIRKGHIVTKYSSSVKHSLLSNLRHLDKSIRKEVKIDLKPFWTEG